jgi:hypothetical membrane protein
MLSRIAGFYGVVGPLIMLSLILVAISRSTGFSWTESALSDLGDSQYGVAVLFNWGLIVGGGLIAIFGIGLKASMPGLTRGSAGAVAVVLGGVSLCVAGIFPNTAGAVHLYISGLLFTLFIVALLLIGSEMMREPSETKLGAFIFKMGLFTCTTGIALIAALLSQGTMALLEFLITLAASVCYTILGFRLLKRGLPQSYRVKTVSS